MTIFTPPVSAEGRVIRARVPHQLMGRLCRLGCWWRQTCRRATAREAYGRRRASDHPVSHHRVLTADSPWPAGSDRTSVQDVIAILGALAAAAVSASVGGGWGVDALVGVQTRPHADLDLLIPREQSETATVALRSLGFALTLDQRPTRFVLTRPDGAEVDLHPLRFVPDGSARLPGLDGVDFVLPAGCLDGLGTIGGHAVRCLTLGQQLTAHAGYDPTERDLWDLELLDEMAHPG